MALYHSVKGPVNYTVVGSPTIVDGVASGFSTSNYLVTSTEMDLRTYSWQMRTKVTMPDSFPTATVGFPIMGTSASRNALILSDTSTSTTGRRLGFYSWHTGESAPNVINPALDAEAGKTYYAEWGFAKGSSSNQFYIRVSEDNENWISATREIGTDEPIDASGVIYLGFCRYYDRYFPGSIDLNETYIKVNGQLWFGNCPVAVNNILIGGPETQQTVTGNNTQLKPNYVIRNDKLVWAKPNMYLSGPTTYITEGSPTIVDNVASGFSSANAIKTTNTVPDLSQGFDVKVRFTTGSSFSEQWIMTPSGADVDFSLTTHPSSTHFVFYYKISGSRGYRFSNFELQTNTTYDFIAHSDGSTIEWTLGTPGNPISQNTISCDFSDFDLTRYIYFGSRLDGYFFKGSIDFNETYIKANGQLWFYGKNYASQNIAPVPSGYNCVPEKMGYTVVGSPTISNGIVSGFSNSNYLTIASNTIDLSNLSVRLRFTANVIDGSEQILFQIGASGSAIPLGFRIHSNNKIVCYHSGTNSNQTYSFANTTLEQGKTYDVEFGAVNSVRYFKCGLADNMTDQAINSGSDTDFAGSVTRATYYGFALYSSSSQASKCSIDINNVYINIGGQLWFSGQGYAPSIGYIDMRTQAFTASPSGATIGRDE